MFYGWNGYEYTFAHIADIYSCSSENIRQIHNKALRQIRKSEWGQRMLTEHEAESRSKKYNVRRGKAVDMAILDDYYKFAY